MPESFGSMSTGGNQSLGVTPERREYARVMDAVGLEFRSEAADADALNAVGSASQHGLIHHYELDGYAEVKRDFPAVTEYIDVLEERIRSLQLGGNVLMESPTHKVSISASGIAFADERLFEPGDTVAMRLTLFPSLDKILCEGTVVSVGDVSELVNDNQHSYRIVFTQISSEDIDLIERHVQSLCSNMRQYPED